MASPVIATKVHAPAPRPGAVARDALLGRLMRGAASKLTLISAPAGFGKTTLLATYAEAAARNDRRVAWLALDASDSAPAVFWTHVVAALQVVGPKLGASVLAALNAGEPPTEALVAPIVNDLAASPAKIDLVLDDYHLVDREEVHEGVAFLVDHLPPNAHVLISTRSDPPLPLSRLRARGDLVEVRSQDLRFTADEARSYLNGTMGLTLAGNDVATLTKRTEGWIAALQLAALSLEGRSDATAFVADFAGNDRYVVDYLLEEVLERQPESVRQFLRRTCFLERLSGPLCEAVTGEGGGKTMLMALERANLFLVPLDSRREWFRYHHLFADVLEVHFATELRDELPLLHQRASAWFAEEGDRPEAIRHALAGRDFERAAGLIERAIPEMRRSRQEAILRTWIEALPAEVIRARPVLNVGFVGTLISIGAFAGIEDRLRDAEDAVAQLQSGDDSSRVAVVDDRSQLPGLPGAIALYRSALAQVRGDLLAVIDHAQRSLDLTPVDEHLGRAAAAGFLGIAYWTRGELGNAQHWWSECREGLRRAGHVADVFGTSIALADINTTLGQLRAAARVFEDALQLGSEWHGIVLRGTADAHAGLAELHLLGGDMAAATEHVLKSEELGEAAGLPQHAYRSRVAMARLRDAENDAEGALDLLDEAERVYVPDFFPNIRPIAARRARILIRHGRLPEARRWQADAGLAVTDAPSFLREFEHMTLARLLIAEHAHGSDGAALEQAIDLLGRLGKAAENGARLGSVIEISALESLALKARGDAEAAMTPLARALMLAEPEGYVRVFLDEGEPMAGLLKLAAKRGITPAFARALLADLGSAEPSARVTPEGLIEPLSERELDVLRLLRSDLDGPEIARELSVSLNTMRTHTKNIYEKLGVNNRRAAVRRAEDLDLLSRQ